MWFAASRYVKWTAKNLFHPIRPLRPHLKDFTMSNTAPTQQRIEQIVKSSEVVLFMKGTAQFPMCGFSGRAIQLLKACGVSKPATVNVLEDEEIRHGIKEYSNWPTIPQLYVRGEFVGGSDIMMEMYESGELQQVLGTPAA
jgi:monothiol glutaredoxin